MFVNYSDLPGNQNIFLDYLYEFENVEKYFIKNFRNIEEYPSFLSELSKKERPQREGVLKIIRSQYSDIRPSKQTEVNIDLLSSNRTFAIVTGQQLGMFGGPLYTLYKTMTAIKLSISLKDKFEGYNFVPVFWLEGDDHDLDEVSYINVIDKANNFSKISYNDGIDKDINRGSVGKVKFTEAIDDFMNTFQNEIRDSDFKQELIDLFKKGYFKGNSFTESFKQLMFDLFDEQGLIIFNPQEKEVKKILKDVFKKELLNFREHTDVLVELSAELEEEYHAQVKVKPINVFASDKEGRYLIEPVEENFRLKNRRKIYSKEEMFEWLENNPEDFSANVLLRPICQDYLLPTAFYVAGPGEISYFAQVAPLYNFFDVPQPYIYPRASATIMEKNVSSVLEKYNLKINDLFFDEKLLIEKVIKSLSEADLENTFSKVKIDIGNNLNVIKDNLVNIDKSLGDLSDKTFERVFQSLDTLMSKAQKAEERNHETAIRQITKARNVFYPNNNFQERELNLTYIVNKYGFDMLKWLLNELVINKFEHQIIEL